MLWRCSRSSLRKASMLRFSCSSVFRRSRASCSDLIRIASRSSQVFLLFLRTTLGLCLSLRPPFFGGTLVLFVLCPLTLFFFLL